jgi:hypothetical protein
MGEIRVNGTIWAANIFLAEYVPGAGQGKRNGQFVGSVITVK